MAYRLPLLYFDQFPRQTRAPCWGEETVPGTHNHLWTRLGTWNDHIIPGIVDGWAGGAQLVWHVLGESLVTPGPMMLENNSQEGAGWKHKKEEERVLGGPGFLPIALCCQG
jgi:hypothetical protein